MKLPVNDPGFAPRYVPFAEPEDRAVFERLTSAEVADALGAPENERAEAEVIVAFVPAIGKPPMSTVEALVIVEAPTKEYVGGWILVSL